jgi:hypothetical protein
MTTKTKLALAAVLLLGIASAAQAGSSGHEASGLGRERIHLDLTISHERASARQPSMNAPSRLPSINAPTCPGLEGYPDCHPGDVGF